MWNTFSITNPNRYCDGNSYCYRNGDTDCHCHNYVDSKTQSKPETPSHTKASSDPTASSITENTHEGFQRRTERI